MIALNELIEMKITLIRTLIALSPLLPLVMSATPMMTKVPRPVTTIALNLTDIPEMIAVETTIATIHAMTPPEETTLQGETILLLLLTDETIVAIHDEMMIITLPLLTVAMMTAEIMIAVETTMIRADKALNMTVEGTIEEILVATTVTPPAAPNLATKIAIMIMMIAETLRSETAIMETTLTLIWNQPLLLAPFINHIHFLYIVPWIISMTFQFIQ